MGAAVLMTISIKRWVKQVEEHTSKCTRDVLISFARANLDKKTPSSSSGAFGKRKTSPYTALVLYWKKTETRLLFPIN